MSFLLWETLGEEKKKPLLSLLSMSIIRLDGSGKSCQLKKKEKNPSKMEYALNVKKVFPANGRRDGV